MLARLRSALVPRDPLYRRESGAGRRTVLRAKILGLLAVVAAYLYWMVVAYAGRDHGQLPVTITAIGCCLFCMIFFALGLQSVRSEVLDNTIEALVMTPASRKRLVLSKLAGSVELVIVAALLLPFYCFTLAPAGHGDRLMAFLHGALLRLALAPDNWISSGELPFAVEAVIGAAAFIGDLAWYAFFAACGVWAASTTRKTIHAWFKGLAVSGGLLLAVTCYEWFLGDPANPHWLVRAIGTGKWYELAYALDFGWRDRPLFWMIAWFAISVMLRLLLAYAFVHRATRSFDQIATD